MKHECMLHVPVSRVMLELARVTSTNVGSGNLVPSQVEVEEVIHVAPDQHVTIQ